MRKSVKFIIAVSSTVFMASGLLSSPVKAANKDLPLVVTQLPAQVRLIPDESTEMVGVPGTTCHYFTRWREK
jgi:hypothetical protein